jgi:hypothetical protein
MAGSCRKTSEINGTWKQYSGGNTASVFHRFPEARIIDQGYFDA